MKHYGILFTLAALLTFSCNSLTDNYDKKAIELNDQAVKLMISNPDSALILLNQATDIDDDYSIAHSNKVGIYISKGDFEDAIRSEEKVVKAKPELAEAVTFLGMLYDYTGQTEKAKEQYSKALELYNSRPATEDNNKTNRVNRAHNLLLLGNNTEGQEEIQKLLNEYPDDFIIQMLVDFDKEKHLNYFFAKK